MVFSTVWHLVFVSLKVKLPVPLEVRWSTGVSVVLHSPQEPLGDKQENHSTGTITEELENAS